MATYQQNRQAALKLSVKPADTTRLGRMLQGGRLTATMRSKKTNQHITLTLHAMAKVENKWTHVLFADATHVFIKQGDGSWGSTKIGTLYPKKDDLYWDTRDEAYQFAAFYVLLASQSGTLDTQHYTIFEESRCGVCGKALTDPVSIERGIGPTCLGALTGSEHYHAAAPKADRPVNPEEVGAAMPSDLLKVVTDRKGRTIPKTFEALAQAARAKV